MSKPLVFISCGQFTAAEQELGRAIAQMVENTTNCEALFAQNVQDLNGLEANILSALKRCAGFIAAMHPRGTITTPDGIQHTRASVWIEQEIAIATYIHRAEKRPLPVIAFTHESIGIEGIRSLLHLNPVRFSRDSEVLVALAQRLNAWKQLTPAGVRIELRRSSRTTDGGHSVFLLDVVLINDSSECIQKYNCMVRIPGGLLRHRGGGLTREAPSDDPHYRVIRTDETHNRQALLPKSTLNHYTGLMCCPQCAINDTGDAPEIGALIVAESVIEATLWVDGREYSESKTVKQLTLSAAAGV